MGISGLALVLLTLLDRLLILGWFVHSKIVSLAYVVNYIHTLFCEIETIIGLVMWVKNHHQCGDYFRLGKQIPTLHMILPLLY